MSFLKMGVDVVQLIRASIPKKIYEVPCALTPRIIGNIYNFRLVKPKVTGVRGDQN